MIKTEIQIPMMPCKMEVVSFTNPLAAGSEAGNLSKMEVASQHCDTVPNKTKDILDTVKIERIC